MMFPSFDKINVPTSSLYIYIHIYLYKVYTYIYIERERERVPRICDATHIDNCQGT